jgi:hypothetical protein
VLCAYELNPKTKNLYLINRYRDYAYAHLRIRRIISYVGGELS